MFNPSTLGPGHFDFATQLFKDLDLFSANVTKCLFLILFVLMGVQPFGCFDKNFTKRRSSQDEIETRSRRDVQSSSP